MTRVIKATTIEQLTCVQSCHVPFTALEASCGPSHSPKNSLMKWFLMMGAKAKKLDRGHMHTEMSAYDFMMAALLPHRVVLLCSHCNASPSVPVAL